jgi:acetyltransferase
MGSSLQAMFNPQSIAVVGASEDRGKLGYNITENLIRFGFSGEIFPISQKHRTVLGRKAYPSLAAIGGPVDLVLSAVGARVTVGIAKECSRSGIKALVVYAANFREVGREGSRLESELEEITEQSDLAVLGPNTPGYINGNLSLNATFFPFRVHKGNIAIITQSGGVGGAIYRKALEENMSIGMWIGVGNRVNVDFADVLLFLDQDETVDVIGIYMEGTERGDQLISAAAKVIPHKPVIMFKAGRSTDANRLALSHTGSISGSADIYRGLLKQAGMIQVDSVAELVCACKGLAVAGEHKGERIGMVTPSGGGSIIVFDLLMEWKCQLPQFTQDTDKNIRRIMNNTNSVVYKNPLDLTTTGFEADLYGRVTEALAMDENIDSIIAIFPIHEYFPPPDDKLIEIRKKVGKPIIVYWIAIDRLNHEYEKRRKVLEDNGIPVFLLPEEATWAARTMAVRSRSMHPSY